MPEIRCLEKYSTQVLKLLELTKHEETSTLQSNLDWIGWEISDHLDDDDNIIKSDVVTKLLCPHASRITLAIIQKNLSRHGSHLCDDLDL